MKLKNEMICEIMRVVWGDVEWKVFRYLYIFGWVTFWK